MWGRKESDTTEPLTPTTYNEISKANVKTLNRYKSIYFHYNNLTFDFDFKSVPWEILNKNTKRD